MLYNIKRKNKKKKRYEMCIIVYLCHYIFKSSFDLINIIKNPINNKLFTIQSVFSLIILLFLWFLHPLFKYLLHNNLFLSIQSHYIIWTQFKIHSSSSSKITIICHFFSPNLPSNFSPNNKTTHSINRNTQKELICTNQILTEIKHRIERERI